MTSTSPVSLSGTGPAAAQSSSDCTMSAPSRAAIAPAPGATAFCIACPRRRRSRAASAKENAPVAASALYSPRECPATSADFCRKVKPPSVSSTRSTAIDIAMSAGWVFSVKVRASAGPSNISCESFCFSASSTSWNTSRAAGKASARARPMPTVWLPWPGKMKAWTGMDGFPGRRRRIGARRDHGTEVRRSFRSK